MKTVIVIWFLWISICLFMTDFTGVRRLEVYRRLKIGVRRVVASRDQNADKVMAMVSGGDDYVEKPFDAELLLVKIRSLLRRSYEYIQSDREYLESGLVYDRGQGILFYENQPIEMTKSENRIMSILADYKGQVVDRETLMQGLWNTDEYVTDASLTVLISRLRSKICAATEGISCIHTRKGKGYYLE